MLKLNLKDAPGYIYNIIPKPSKSSVSIAVFFSVAFILLFIFFSRTNNKIDNLQEKMNAAIQQEKVLQDSLLKIVNAYKPPDINQVSNYYSNKYEKEAAVIKSFGADADIQFFANWYSNADQRLETP